MATKERSGAAGRVSDPPDQLDPLDADRELMRLVERPEQLIDTDIKIPDEKAIRSGLVSGAKIVRLVAQRPMSPAEIAEILVMHDGYVRRICRVLAKAGVLVCEIVPQRGTPPLRVYSIVPSPDKT